MNEFVEQNQTIDNSNYSFFTGVQFDSNPRAYFFGYKDMDIANGDKVVVETVRGLELGTVVLDPVSIDKYKSELGLKPILRKASEIDIKIYENNKKDAVFALNICKTESDKLQLNMNLVSCEYTLDKAKVIFSYLADDRVDFRELLKILASKLHTRIELRQIGPRDKAKMIGGLGVCGLPLCCSTFLNEFDGISIARAKNQMLAINIPKLSGQCGKLICCLKFEDDVYTEARQRYPELGSKVFIDKVEYTITSVNIINGVLKIENAEDVKFIEYNELKKQAYFPKKKFNKQEKDNRNEEN